MASGLNSRNAMVNVLDDEHFEAKQARFKFVRYCLISGIIDALLCSTAYIIMGSYIRSGVHFFVIFLTFFLTIRDTVRKLNLKTVSGIIFDNAEYTTYANNELVFEATRKLCEMKGFVRGRQSAINMIHIISAISVLIELAEYIIGGLL